MSAFYFRSFLLFELAYFPAAENNSAPSEAANSEVDEYYHPTVQVPEANGEIPSVEVQDNENEQQPSDENTDINE